MGLETGAKITAQAFAETELGVAVAAKLADAAGLAKPFVNTGVSQMESAAKQTDLFLSSLPQAAGYKQLVLGNRAQEAELMAGSISDVRSLGLSTNDHVFKGMMRTPKGKYDEVIIHTPESRHAEAIEALGERFRQEHAIQSASPFLFNTVPVKVWRPVTINGELIPEAMVQPVVGEGMAASIRRMSGMPKSSAEADIDKGLSLTSEYRKYSNQLNELTENPRIHRIVDAATVERLGLSSDFHFGNWRGLLRRDDGLERMFNIDNSFTKGDVPRWVGGPHDYYYGWSSLPIAGPNVARLGQFQSVADTKAGHTWLRGIGMTRDEALDTVGKVSWLRRGKYPDVE